MSENTQLLPKRPYLVRAMYQWLLDNTLTPHLLVDTSLFGVRVPQQFIKDERIVLNIAPHAVGHFELQDDEITFNARFGGVAQSIRVPMAAVLAIYARENSEGMMFEPEPYYDEGFGSDFSTMSSESSATATETANPVKKKPFLRIVE